MKQSDEKWREQLTEEEFRVTRQRGTERPFTGKLLDNNEQGDYVCKCCGAKLFDSDHKFDAGCGWPSFDAQSKDGNVEYRPDYSHGMERTEIVCKQCDAHLGHVFNDGPTETRQRYCVNSVSLDFKKA